MTFETHTAELVKVAAQVYLDRYMIRNAAPVMFEMIGEQLAARIVTHVLRGPVIQETRTPVCVPASWWEALKQEYAPAWFLRRWPVRVREIGVSTTAVYNTCPHIAVNRNAPHINFLFNREDTF
jgi:hypothetical protein